VRKTGCREIVCQSIEPDIHDMTGRIRNWNAPVECRARRREVLESTSDETQDLVAAFRRTDEIRLLLVERQQSLLISGEPEEITLLLDPFDGSSRLHGKFSAVALFDLVFAIIGLVADRIPTGIFSEIDVPVADHASPKLAHRYMVARFGGAD